MQGFPKFKGFAGATDFSSSRPEAKSFFDLLDERLAANRNALCLFGLSAFILSLYRTFYPLEMGLFQLLIGFKSQQSHQPIKIDNSFPCPGILDLIIAATFPLSWMIHHADTDHVHVDIGNALTQMAVTFHGGCMIAVLPECPLYLFAYVIFLAGSAGDPFNRIRDDIMLAVVKYKQVNIILHAQTAVPFYCLVQPFHPSAAIFCEF